MTHTSDSVMRRSPGKPTAAPLVWRPGCCRQSWTLPTADPRLCLQISAATEGARAIGLTVGNEVVSGLSTRGQGADANVRPSGTGGAGTGSNERMEVGCCGQGSFLQLGTTGVGGGVASQTTDPSPRTHPSTSTPAPEKIGPNFPRGLWPIKGFLWHSFRIFH